MSLRSRHSFLFTLHPTTLTDLKQRSLSPILRISPPPLPVPLEFTTFRPISLNAMIPDRIEERIRTAYARPRISDVSSPHICPFFSSHPITLKAWLDQCCTHLIEAVGLDPVADEDNFYSSVEQHFLFSSLRESTDPGTGFALSDVFTEGFGTNDVPVLVEVSDMTDVGISAFDLILKWNERASAFPGTFPPSYPRGMLKVHLSDGHEERLAAEIKYISTLILGETPLGTKVGCTYMTAALSLTFCSDPFKECGRQQRLRLLASGQNRSQRGPKQPRSVSHIQIHGGSAWTVEVRLLLLGATRSL